MGFHLLKYNNKINNKHINLYLYIRSNIKLIFNFCKKNNESDRRTMKRIQNHKKSYTYMCVLYIICSIFFLILGSDPQKVES